MLLASAAENAAGYALRAALVLAGIGVAAWAFRRFVAPRLGLAPRRSKSRRMRVVERLPLEPRRSLYLVRVDDAEYLLGAAEGSVRLVDRLEPPPSADEASDGGEAPP